MATYKTTGIILRRHNYGEADRIYTILTPDGKISAIAKSVRRIRAKLASHLEVFTTIDFMLAEGKNLDVITGARARDQYPLSVDYQRLRTGFLFLEMADKLSQQQETEEIYACLREGLDALAIHPPPAVELAFKLRLLYALGQQPDVEVTCDSRKPLQPGATYYFDVTQGGVVEGATQAGAALTPAAVKLWRVCLRSGIHQSAGITGAQAAAEESLRICDQFYEYMYGMHFKAADI
jgi:DNA repair protein RecO (recombination protein O)